MKDKTNHIIEKATKLFMQNGLHSVSMDNIASYAGISKKTLYENFAGKEILVNTIVEKIISKTNKYLFLCPDISPNAIIEIENFSSYIRSVLEILTPAFVRDLKKYYPDAYMQLGVFRDNSIIPYLERCLQRGIAEEIFRPDIDKANVGWFYCWQIQSALGGDTSQTDINKIIKNANNFFLHGILNSKGLKLVNMIKHQENPEQEKKLRTG